jgi:hypothetical protein
LLKSSTNVLIIGRNRPDHLRNLLTSPALQGHKLVYIFLDGYDDLEKNIELFQETQQIAKDFLIDDPKKLYIYPRKLGCYKGVTAAIDWFFENVEEGLILEDDLFPHPEILLVTQDVLAKFKGVKSIGSVSFYRATKFNEMNAVKMSRYPSSWGWATWKDRWRQFDHKAEKKIIIRPTLLYRHGGYFGLRRWYNVIARLNNGDLDSWAYRWMFTFWLKKKYSLVLPLNMIENHGFGNDSTHTKNGFSNTLDKDIVIDTKVWTSNSLAIDEEYDRALLRLQFGKN